MVQASATTDWKRFTDRYRNGEWRGWIFRDLVLADAQAMRPKPTMLDIGCGKGFDNDLELQKAIAAAAGEYIGIEPDPEIPLSPLFTATHRCFFEDAPIAPGSIDLAFATMVLEHIPKPDVFWAKVLEVLAPGGVFWGFTVDARHYFCRLSMLTEKINIKDWYLNRMHGKRGAERYENYPVHYLANSPEQVLKSISGAAKCDFLNFSRVGQLDYYVPRVLRPLTHFFDRRAVAKEKPGILLAIRVQREMTNDKIRMTKE